MFCLIRHELKNNNNVRCPEKELYKASVLRPVKDKASVLILQKDKCQNALGDHVKGQKWIKMEKISVFFSGKGLVANELLMDEGGEMFTTFPLPPN